MMPKRMTLKAKLPKVQLEVRIGGQKWPAPPKSVHTDRSIGKVGTARVVSEVPSEGAFDIDLTDELQVVALHAGSETVTFTGVVVSAGRTDDDYTLVAHDLFQVLQETTISFARSPALPGRELMSYIATVGGFPPERQSIDGSTMPTTPQEYRCVIPIEGLTIGGSLHIGSVRIYDPASADGEDALIGVLVGDDPARIAIWRPSTFGARAAVTVSAMNFLDAQQEAKSVIEGALDWLSFRFSVSEIALLDDHRTPITWDRSRSIELVRASNWVYARRLPTGAIFILDLESPRPTSISLLSASGNYLSELLTHLSAIAGDTNALSPKVRALRSALHWLRRAKDDARPIDRLLDHWTTLEFLTSLEESPEIFSQAEKRNLLSNARQSSKMSEEQLRILRSAVDNLNQRPLMMKIHDLCSSLGVSLSEEENRLLRRTRNQRNDIIHGRTTPTIADDDLRKLGHFARKVTLRLASSLASS